MVLNVAQTFACNNKTSELPIYKMKTKIIKYTRCISCFAWCHGSHYYSFDSDPLLPRKWPKFCFGRKSAQLIILLVSHLYVRCGVLVNQWAFEFLGNSHKPNKSNNKSSLNFCFVHQIVLFGSNNSNSTI